ncbi:hypothetical protein ACFLZ6_01435 [Nanoarchaeota archaeon]
MLIGLILPSKEEFERHRWEQIKEAELLRFTVLDQRSLSDIMGEASAHHKAYHFARAEDKNAGDLVAYMVEMSKLRDHVWALTENPYVNPERKRYLERTQGVLEAYDSLKYLPNQLAALSIVISELDKPILSVDGKLNVRNGLYAVESIEQHKSSSE